MPTVLFILGWRLHFYANENREPIHIHAEKGDMECKYYCGHTLQSRLIADTYW